ncbi:hypothetical protein GCM10010176_001960 [Nonomuraea spiralis]|nr:hypothetical protein GCM10010176_001960 [Nonomuraea spiralis]
MRARLSKGLSLPGRLPDVLGPAVRLPSGVDLLLSTGAGCLPVPRRTFTSGPYSSLSPYVYGTGLYRLVARPEGERVPADPALPGEDLTFDLVLNSRPCLVPPDGRSGCGGPRTRVPGRAGARVRPRPISGKECRDYVCQCDDLGYLSFLNQDEQSGGSSWLCKQRSGTCSTAM